MNFNTVKLLTIEIYSRYSKETYRTIWNIIDDSNNEYFIDHNSMNILVDIKNFKVFKKLNLKKNESLVNTNDISNSPFGIDILKSLKLLKEFKK